MVCLFKAVERFVVLRRHENMTVLEVSSLLRLFLDCICGTAVVLSCVDCGRDSRRGHTLTPPPDPRTHTYI